MTIRSLKNIEGIKKFKELICFIVILYNVGFVICQEGDLKDKPDRCNAPPSLLYRNCCVFPPFFNQKVARECGARTIVQFEDKVNNITSYRRNTVRSCQHWACVLDKYNLLDPDGLLDENKYFSHLDRWVDLNLMFADAVLEAKVSCKDAIRRYLPLKPCEFYYLHGCIRHHVNISCPVTMPTKECDEYKAFFNECKEFYVK